MRKPQTVYEWVRLGATTAALYQTAEAYVERYGERRRTKANSKLYSVSISADEDAWLYRRISKWALDQVSDETRKRIVVARYNDEFVEIPNEDDQEITIYLNGNPIRFWWHQVGGDQAQVGGMTFNIKQATQLLTMICPTLEARKDLLNILTEKFFVSSEQINHVYRSVKGGGWSHVRRLSPRKQDSLILPEGMYPDMSEDLTRFLDAKQAYFDRGIPWHRGFLMYGPPGTGKSSTITVLAHEFDRNVHFCSLADLESNSALIECVSNLRGNAFLVLEDVDIVRSSHERTEEDGVTLDGLLNVLDGVLTPDGLITFMTTNEVKKLDSALIRPGRADRQFNLGFLTQDQLDSMVQRFVGPHEQIHLERQDAVPAEIIECLKSSFDQPPDFILNCIREVVSKNYQSRYVRPKAPNLTATSSDNHDDVPEAVEDRG